MLLAGVATMQRPAKPMRLVLSSVDASAEFFERFGFVLQVQMPVPSSGRRLDVKPAILDGVGWDKCRNLPNRMGDIEVLPPRWY